MKRNAAVISKITSIFLSALMPLCTLSLASCKGDKKEEGITLGPDYKIIYPASASQSLKDFAQNAADLMKEVLGVELSVLDDSSAVSDKEILVGETNREESEAAKEKLGEGDEYVVAAIGKKLVIYATSSARYTTVLSYLSSSLITGANKIIASDFCHTGNKISVFTLDEKVEGKTRVDITLTPDSIRSEAGIFVGNEYANAPFGYRGYALIASQNAITLYEITSKLSQMASRKINCFKAGDDIKLRLEVDGYKIGAYLLDDCEGVEPWPEFELKTSDTEDYSVGFVELSGNGAKYRDLSVTYPEKEDTTGKKYYTNSIYDDYADPDVLYFNGKYYLYGTGGSGYIAHSSSDLVNWKKENTVLEPNLWGITKNYWAPDLECINGKIYMVVTCDEHLGITVSDSPLGPFTPVSDTFLYDRAIDGHLFVDDDQKIYLYYVSLNAYGIYGVQLDGNMQPCSPTRRLITPTEDWEKHEGDVVEGPYMLKHNGMYYLTYSGSHYKSADYAVGYATSNKPLGTFKKYDLNPIMKGNTQIHGTGHHCITTTPDGKEMLIVYHCHNSLTKVEVRKICIDRIRFAPVEGDIDRLEVYGPTVTKQERPKE